MAVRALGDLVAGHDEAKVVQCGNEPGSAGEAVDGEAPSLGVFWKIGGVVAEPAIGREGGELSRAQK